MKTFLQFIKEDGEAVPPTAPANVPANNTGNAVNPNNTLLIPKVLRRKSKSDETVEPIKGVVRPK